MIRTIIISGGNINEDFLKNEILKGNYKNIIAVDKGLEMLDKCKVKPKYIIGDFDSLNENILEKYINDSSIKIIKLNPEKDYTDTHMAIKLAIELESKEITIIGAIGTRIDHTLANIHILKEPLEKEIKCNILNENNNITLINKTTIIKNKYPYISLIPLTTNVEGVTLKGFKYTLNNATLKIGESIGVSNEQIEDEGIIEIGKGILIIIQAKD
ncbi:MAG: thiamine diphosphokinase [Clostridia bacterium]|nr:thiamine diphosphokinase [Clostridia bacterium]